MFSTSKRSTRIVAAVPGLVLLLFLATGCQKGQEPMPAGPPAISGVITRIESQGKNTGQVLVEAKPGETTGPDKAMIQVTPETRIQRRSGHLAISAGDLRTGQRVSAWFTGPVMESYPVLATAEALLVDDVPLRPAPPGEARPPEKVPPGEDEPDGTAGGTADGEPPEPGGEIEEPPAGEEEEPSTPDDTGPSGWTAGIVNRPGTGEGIAVLKAVREASHEDYDRVVFEFEGDTRPGYHVEYVDRPVRGCGSGEAVPVAGDAWLEVRFTPSQAHDEGGRPTVLSRNRMTSFPVIEQIRLTCDFEGHVTWVLGVSSPHRYQVLQLSDPARLVIDVKH